MIRRAREDDLPLLQDIERAAGAPFRDLGMELVADDEPPTVSELREFQRAELAWVVADDNSDRPVAYMLLHAVDGWLNIEQISVTPSYGRRGIGRQLIDLADRLSSERGLSGLTLTTYVDVPWNGPYYERLGFHILPDHEMSQGMKAVRTEEARRGLDAWPRAVMTRRRRA